jgi:hypothetical protein
MLIVVTQNFGENMRKAFALAMAFGVASLSAQAQDLESHAALQPFVGIGFTWGGDTILPVTLIPTGSTTQYHEDISAGAGLDLRLGLSYRLAGLPVSIQGALAYHNDQASGLTGDFRFRRYPIELTLQYHLNDKGRIGFGVRKTTNNLFATRGGYYVDSNGAQQPYPETHEKLTSSPGIIVEGEYDVTPSWGLKARYVHETFKFANYPNLEKLDGSHVGLMSVWYFR